MKTTVVISLLFLCLFPCIISAGNAISCRFEIYQYDDEYQDILLYADTASLLKGINTNAFFLSFSLDIEVTEIDSLRTGFNCHIITLGPKIKTLSRKVTTEYQLPVVIDQITGKDDVIYKLVIIPLESRDIDTSHCPFVHYNAGLFSIIPSTNFDFNFLLNSLADYNLTTISNLIEDDYGGFKQYFGLTLPGKQSIFLCPCDIRSVVWDRRFMMSLNPTKNIAFCLYNNRHNSADPFIATHTALLKSWGYAPLFLSEGAANYYMLSEFQAKQLKNSGELPKLRKLLKTLTYTSYDPRIADLTSASFIKYLINQYTLTTFKQLYGKAHDLNLQEMIETTYRKPLQGLESEWHHYLDTVTINKDQKAKSAIRAEVLGNFNLTESLISDLLLTGSENDSIIYLPTLRRIHFNEGSYIEAVTIQKVITRLKGRKSSELGLLGGYQLMSGQYEDGRMNLEEALKEDTTNTQARFNLAVYHRYNNHDAKARELLLKMPVTGKGNQRSADLILLGEILIREPDTDSQKQGREYLRQAVNLFQRMIGKQPSVSTSFMWAGIGLTLLGDYQTAAEFLETTFFLEERPFYLGISGLWLGKLADINKDHEKAVEFYQYVIDIKSADYTRQEALKYIDQPYSPPGR